MDKERELLGKLRGHMAFKKGIEPYKVFRDVELELLLEHKPKTIAELASIKGFPMEGKRVAGYGEAIIKIFNDADRIEDFDVQEKNGELTVTTVLKPMDLF